MAHNNEPLVDSIGFVWQAMWQEMAENPCCPLAQSMGDLMVRYKTTGDIEALDMAVQIARQTLTPRKSLGVRIRERLGL